MKKLFPYIILVLFLTSSNLHSQNATDKNNFSFQVQDEEGDLNNDNLPDHIVLKMDTITETRPLRLQIYLSQPNNNPPKLIISTTKLIESQYPSYKNGEHNGNPIPNIFIEEKNLVMLTNINDRKSRYEFRFNKDEFELIKISRVKWDGKDTTRETEIDLIKGTKKQYDRDFSPTNKNIKNTKLKPMNSLPKIQNLTFSDLEKF